MTTWGTGSITKLADSGDGERMVNGDYSRRSAPLRGIRNHDQQKQNIYRNGIRTQRKMTAYFQRHNTVCTGEDLPQGYCKEAAGGGSNDQHAHGVNE
jgi:hypothetical protein